MDIRSHEIIDRRRDLATENGNNGAAAAAGNNVSSISNEDNCNGGNNNNNNTRVSSNSQTLDHTPKSQSSKSTTVIKYRECLKNHAANVGGSVHDGCGEFMPSGEEGTIEALRCAACDCHRNFHRKEIDGPEGINHHRSYHHQYNTGGGGGGGGGRRLTPPSGMNMMLNPLMLPPPPSYPPLHHHHHHHSHKYGMNSPGGGGIVTPMSVAYGGGGGSGGGGGGGAESSSEDLNMYGGQSSGEQGGVFQMSKKRFRTKFTTDQKERMMEFAEKLGWRMNKQDEEELKRFCGEIGVKRQVFKVWMHNNKNNAKKQLLPSSHPLI